MKRILFLALFMGIALLGMSQEGVVFEDLGFNEALAKAKVEHKMVFVDCYTSWCGPCKQMVAKEFPKRELGDYINPRFVSLKIDMEKGEGKELRKRFDVSLFPTFLFLSDEGEILYRTSGYRDAMAFVEEVKNGLTKGELRELTKRYEQGERSSEFIEQYLLVLKRNDMTNKRKQVAEEFLLGKEAELLTDIVTWRIFSENITSPESSIFQYVYVRNKEFVKKYGEGCNRLFEARWANYPDSFLKRTGKEVIGIDEEQMTAYVKLMKKYKVPTRKYIQTKYGLMGATGMKKWQEALMWIEKYVEMENVEEDVFLGACLGMTKGLQNEKERMQLYQVMQKRIKTLAAVKDSRLTYQLDGERISPTEFFRRYYVSLCNELKSKS